MSLTLYLLRHGQTELSREDNFCGAGLDPELTQQGLEMAEAFTAAYKVKVERDLLKHCASCSSCPAVSEAVVRG